MKERESEGEKKRVCVGERESVCVGESVCGRKSAWERVCR